MYLIPENLKPLTNVIATSAPPSIKRFLSQVNSKSQRKPTFRHLQHGLLLKIQKNSAVAQHYCTQTTCLLNPCHYSQTNAHVTPQSNWGRNNRRYYKFSKPVCRSEKLQRKWSLLFPKDKTPRLIASAQTTVIHTEEMND